MKRRIALWSLSGCVVAAGWVAFLNPAQAWGEAIWIAVVVTAPPALLHVFPLKYYWFVLLNGATYALVGLLFESARRKFLRAAH